MKLTTSPYKQKPILNKRELKIVNRSILAIEKRDGLITPGAIVTDAKPKRSPLHKYFEWNDTLAAEAHRLEQARYLIRQVYVVIEDGEDQVITRGFNRVIVPVESDTEDSARQSGYMSASRVARQTSLRDQVLDYAKRQILTWRTKFGHYKEFFAVVEVIDKTIKPKG